MPSSPSGPMSEVATPPKWVRPSIERKKLRELVSQQNCRASFHLMARVAVQAVTVTAAFVALTHGLWIVAVPLVLISGALWTFFGWAGLSHELFHSTVFRQRRVNSGLFKLFSVATWGNYGYFSASHWLHHKYTRYEQDPEAVRDAPITTSEILRGATIDIPGFLSRVIVLVKNASGFVPNHLIARISYEQKRQVISGARIVLLCQALLVSGFLILGLPELVLLVVLAPFTATLPVRCLELQQHKDCERNVPDVRRTTRTLILNPALSFLYCNMNYHVEHHLLPSVPYYRLPQLRRELLDSGFVSPERKSSFWSVMRMAASRSPRQEDPSLA